MQRLTTRLHGTRRLVLGIFIFGAGIGAGIALTALLLTAFVPQGAVANHDGSGNIHACVSRFTGQARVMLSGRQPNCSSYEVLVEFAGPGAIPDVSALVARLDALEADSTSQQSQIDAIGSELLALDDQVPDCLSDSSGDALFTGCNVQIINGEGTTDTTNGSGNLIVGYNEDLLLDMELRGGSHNVVIGPDHTYSSYGGLVAGYSNNITGPHASISGGENNQASGERATVSGGQNNRASAPVSSVSGGFNNDAIGVRSSVSGGDTNVASGDAASVSGGWFNTASGQYSSVSGGGDNEASGQYSSVSGGGGNQASGTVSSVSGGDVNTASGEFSSVSGGAIRTASGYRDWVAGTLFEDD